MLIHVIFRSSLQSSLLKMSLSESLFAFRSYFPKSEKAKKVPENPSNDEFSGKMAEGAGFEPAWTSLP